MFSRSWAYRFCPLIRIRSFPPRDVEITVVNESDVSRVKPAVYCVGTAIVSWSGVIAVGHVVAPDMDVSDAAVFRRHAIVNDAEFAMIHNVAYGCDFHRVPRRRLDDAIVRPH